MRKRKGIELLGEKIVVKERETIVGKKGDKDAKNLLSLDTQ